MGEREATMGKVLTTVWRPGVGAQKWVTGPSVSDFKQQDETLFGSGMRLRDLVIEDDDCTAVWQPGTGKQHWETGLGGADLEARDNDLFAKGLPHSVAQLSRRGLHRRPARRQQRAALVARTLVPAAQGQGRRAGRPGVWPGRGRQVRGRRRVDDAHFSGGLRLIHLAVGYTL
jgi:hypothetical protein